MDAGLKGFKKRMVKRIGEADCMNEWEEKVCAEIKAMTRPDKIILYNEKTGMGGSVSAFKLCVVVEAEDPRRLEEQIYMQVDSPVSFDVLVYSREDWDRLLGEPGSFAQRIDRTGRLLYGQER